MGDHITVEPAALRGVGQTLASAAEESGHAFNRHASGLTDAAAGLFSGSRAALQDKVEVWRSATSALTERVDGHGSHLHTSAALYESTDGHTSTALYDATSDSGRQALNLDS